jgi:3-oxoadipate enol-lactonase
VYYERSGDGEPLLLIQGMTGTHAAWGRPFLSRLERDFECIVYDHRGIGYSSRVSKPFTIAELAEDAAGLLDELGIERAHLLGISLGGMIAQELALSYPERLRSLILGGTYCGGPGSQLMDPADFQTLIEAMTSGDLQRALRVNWELNLSPGFRAEAGRYAEFVEMAEAAPVPQTSVQLKLQASAVRQRRPDRGADARRPPRAPRGRRPHVLVGAARALRGADPRPRARLGLRPVGASPQEARYLPFSTQPAGVSLPLTLNT